jgi:DNA invertase Pin-like site-specific DNA recombinase
MADDSIPNPERPRSPKRAKAHGVKLGRKPKLTDHQKREAIRRRDGDGDGETQRGVARSYNVSQSTISRLSA